MDLHVHTPASSDFQQPEFTYLEILQRAETRGLDIIAFTDHNTVAGYRRMQDEIQQLELLERLNRLMPDEKSRLQEFRRLESKMLILPGVEFTATLGFHIIGIFPPEKPVREIEHILLSLNIPPSLLDNGSATVGATDDVLTAYKLINQAGGLVIAAHANSSNGVAMKGYNFGGQTKIAYTQDTYLHALEVTDLEVKGPRSTAAFFNGTKPEYPRRMHCIQGSDCHRLSADAVRKKNLGVGDRTTDIFLPELSFEAIKDVFTGNDFQQIRPHRHKEEEPAIDFVLSARDEGPNIIQAFHENLTVRGGKLYNILSDICAFANTNGGTLYIGLSSEARKPVVGVSDPEQGLSLLNKELSSRISPPLQCTIDVQDVKGKKIVRVLIPRGDDPPYALDDNKIYIRNEAETSLAVRDEIVGLVLRHTQNVRPAAPEQPEAVTRVQPEPQNRPETPEDQAPRTGVEVVRVEDRENGRFYTMRDLRNGNIVKNVTRASARRLWHYAITAYSDIID
jgi:PHP family Zn ribbon phosphoesterase